MISIIIPALNEEKYIGQVVAKVKPLVNEVVVVDDDPEFLFVARNRFGFRTADSIAGAMNELRL